MTKTIARVVAHAVRSVIGTNGVAERLRKVELGVAELLRGGVPADGSIGTAPAVNGEPGRPDAPKIDHNMMIHEARGALLRSMPPGAKRLLSAGCSGAWYFDWVSRCYGDVPEHLGIEYYMARPDDLPRNVTWIANTASDMSDVASASCDLVFSGQNIEHLWPAEVVAFLAEAARVLHGGGHLVIDSPNRDITAAMNYTMAEHTVELSVEEIQRAVTLAGFDVTKTVGIWLCRDPRTGRVLPFDSNQSDADWSITERLTAAHDQPNNSFIWWLEATRSARAPDLAALHTLMDGIFAEAWPERIQRLIPYPGRTVERRGDTDWIVASPGEPGFVMYGPYMPLRPGRYQCTFFFATEASDATENHQPFAACDIVGGPDTATLARGEVSRGSHELTLDFVVDTLLFAGQFRCVSLGHNGFSVARQVVLNEPGSNPEISSAPRPLPDHTLPRVKAPVLTRTDLRTPANNEVARLIYPHHHFPTLRSEHVAGAVLYSDRKEMVRGLNVARGGTIAEVGVALGDFSEFLIEELVPARFIAIDTFDMHNAPEHWGTPSKVLFQNKTHLRFYQDRFAALGRAIRVIEGTSHQSLPLLTDGTFDLIYIDAAHDYDSVSLDGRLAAEKLKPDGILVFNDYVMMDHLARTPYGVVPAVNEMVVNGPWRVVGFALQQHLFCDIALRRMALGAA